MEQDQSSKQIYSFCVVLILSIMPSFKQTKYLHAWGKLHQVEHSEWKNNNIHCKTYDIPCWINYLRINYLSQTWDIYILKPFYSNEVNTHFPSKYNQKFFFFCNLQFVDQTLDLMMKIYTLYSFNLQISRHEITLTREQHASHTRHKDDIKS